MAPCRHPPGLLTPSLPRIGFRETPVIIRRGRLAPGHRRTRGLMTGGGGPRGGMVWLRSLDDPKRDGEGGWGFPRGSERTGLGMPRGRLGCAGFGICSNPLSPGWVHPRLRRPSMLLLHPRPGWPDGHTPPRTDRHPAQGEQTRGAAQGGSAQASHGHPEANRQWRCPPGEQTQRDHRGGVQGRRQENRQQGAQQGKQQQTRQDLGAGPRGAIMPAATDLMGEGEVPASGAGRRAGNRANPEP